MIRPYKPSNGQEGRAFEAKFCRNCGCDDVDAVMDGLSDGCPILANALADVQPSQWVQNEPEGPTCTAFVPRRPGDGALDPYQAERDRARYEALPRDPISGRPVIA